MNKNDEQIIVRIKFTHKFYNLISQHKVFEICEYKI